jgi:hypothetical protein
MPEKTGAAEYVPALMNRRTQWENKQKKKLNGKAYSGS